MRHKVSTDDFNEKVEQFEKHSWTKWISIQIEVSQSWGKLFGCFIECVFFNGEGGQTFLFQKGKKVKFIFISSWL